MKKNLAMRVASLVLMCTIVTSCFVSSTFAKYTSSASGSDTVTVAKWAVKAGAEGSELDISGSTQALTFNLFDTILDTNGNAAEQDVAAGKIAPGTKGSFALSVKNESEVNAEYTISFEYDGVQLPLTYSIAIDGANKGSSLDGASVGGTLNMTDNTADNVVVTWEWPFEAVSPNTNAADTSLGVAHGTAEVTATLVVTQVD